MKSPGVWLVAIAAFLMARAPGMAQNDVNLDQGLKPYGSYMGGNLDTVSLTNGNLMLHIPLVSYPQRGGRLNLAFYLRYNNKGFAAIVNGTAVWGFEGIGVDVQRDQLIETRTRRPQFAVPGDNGTAHIFVTTTSMTTADGSSHDVSWSGQGKGFGAGPIDGSALGQHGVIHHLVPNASLLVDPSCTNSPISTWSPVISEDPNGNQIVTSALGWTDTMGRLIPGEVICPVPFSPRNTDQGIYAGAGNALDAIKGVGVRMLPGVKTTDLSGCPANTVSARIWLLPTFANSASPSPGTTAPMKFCYANFVISSDFGVTGTADFSGLTVTMLQNVILPNSTMWSFSYNSHGDLVLITFPTGGTIAYEWANFRFCSGASRALTSRTVTDDSGPHTWRYTWSPGVWTNFNAPAPPTSVLVTDPAPDLNQSVHVSNPVAGGCSYYETHAEYYQGSQQSGALLKQVDTAYVAFGNPAAKYTHAGSGGAFPTTTTTTWGNGSVTKEQIDYDTPTAYTDWDLLCYNCADTPLALSGTRINGQVAADSVFDYGTGAPGPLLRKTAKTYLTLDDPSSVITYDGSGNTCARTDFAYDDPNRLVPSNVSQSHTTPYAGAVRANPSSVTRWLSSTPCAPNATWSPITTLSKYFDSGEIASSTDTLNNETTYSYAPIFYGAFLTQTKLPDTVTNGATFHHVVSGDYDFNTGMLRTFTDQNNNSSTYLFDNMWRVTNANFADGGQAQFNYPDPKTVEKRQLQNAQTGVWIDQFVNFDGLGRQTKTQLKHPGGDVFATTVYDGLGRAATVSNPYRATPSATDGATTTHYDGLGRPTQITKQDSSVSTISYFGPCATTTDEAGKARRACSDGAGRLTEVDEPGDSSAPASGIPGSSATVTIGGPGEQSRFIPARPPTPCRPVNTCPPPDGTGGDTTVFDAGTVYVTANGHTNQAPYAQGDSYQTIATALANAINSDPAASVNAQLGGVTLTLTPRSSATPALFSLVCPAPTWDTADFANPSFATSCAAAAPVFSGHAYVTLYAYDALSNLTCVEQHGNVSGTGCGALASSDATSPWRIRRFTYDSLSRLLTASNPESGQMTYQYNASGDLLSKTDARGITTSYSPSDMPIDALHRVLKTTYSNNDPAVISTYDQAINGIGRLASTSNGAASTAYAYDKRGRVTNQSYCFPSTCTESLSASAAYDQAGNMTQLTYPSGRGIAFGYNSANQPNKVQFALWNNLTPQYGVYTYWSVDDTDFLPSGVPANAAFGNGMSARQSLNSRLQLSGESAVGAGNVVFEGHTYSYGAQNNGNVMGITDQLNPGRSQSFSYDALSRLAAANEGRWGLSFVYDPWGNRLQQNLTSGTAGTSVLVADVRNRLVSYTYDPAGNMLYDGFHQYAYDAQNRIKTVDTTAAAYTYNAAGERVRRDSAGAGTEYIYFGGQVIAEKEVATGYWSDYIFSGGKRIARANNFERQLRISGQKCSGCTDWQWYQFNFNSLGLIPSHPIQAGDTLRWLQWQNPGSVGGVIITFTDGTDSCCTGGIVISDQNGQPIATSAASNQWSYRVANLNAVVGKTIAQIRVYADGTSQPGQWNLYFQDLVFTGADGTVQPLFSQNPTVPSLSGFGSAGMTQTSASINTCVGPGCAPVNTTTYYHGDHIGSSRLLTGGYGYPVWQGTFLPYGEEYNPQLTTNHYKFTGKERDAETGLDYFGARYYSNGLGRFTSADHPFADQHAGNPQTWNLYTYGRNNPLGGIDPTGRGYICLECLRQAVSNWWNSGVKRDGGVGNFAKQNGIGAAKGTGAFGFNTVKTGVALGQASQLNIPGAVATMMTPLPKPLQPSNQTQAQASTATQVTLTIATAAIPIGGTETAATTTLFRAVGTAEAESIEATGAFTQSLSTGSEFKGFFFNEADASSFGSRMTEMTGDTHSVVSGEAPTDLVNASPAHNAATEGPGVLIKNENLPQVKVKPNGSN